MSFHYGANGVFGLRLFAWQDRLGRIYQDFVYAMNNWPRYLPDDGNWTDEDRDAPGHEFDDEDREETQDVLIERFKPELLKAFEKLGVTVPPEAKIYTTPAEDDVFPGSDVEGEEYLIGFGIFTDPWAYPFMHQSFRDKAAFHTWVTGG